MNFRRVANREPRPVPPPRQRRRPRRLDHDPRTRRLALGLQVRRHPHHRTRRLHFNPFKHRTFNLSFVGVNNVFTASPQELVVCCDASSSNEYDVRETCGKAYNSPRVARERIGGARIINKPCITGDTPCLKGLM